MTRHDPRKHAREHLMKARERLVKTGRFGSPLSKESLITAIRATREQLWDAKLAHRS